MGSEMCIRDRLGPEAGPRMVTYAPADEESRRRLEKLHAIALERTPAVPA